MEYNNLKDQYSSEAGDYSGSGDYSLFRGCDGNFSYGGC